MKTAYGVAENDNPTPPSTGLGQYGLSRSALDAHLIVAIVSGVLSVGRDSDRVILLGRKSVK